MKKYIHNDKLQQARLSRGWKQEVVAVKLGVDVRTVRRWESGYPVSPLNIVGLTDLFGMSAEELGVLETLPDPQKPLISQGSHSQEKSNLPIDVGLQDTGEDHINNMAVKNTLPKTPSRSNTLPLQATILIGREQEKESVKRLLRRKEVRLLTLTGPGGTGKTRLGIQVAEELQDMFADGVFFVNLAPIGDPALVIATIARALGIREIRGQSLLEDLKVYLQDKHLLLLLDNFEQVVSAAGEVANLLSVCPELKVLITSREVLHLQAEQEFNVPPLALPEDPLSAVAVLSCSPAVALYIQRAQAVKPDFELTAANSAAVAEICTHLDGLPLAIELAAARSKLFLPQALLRRLDRRFLVLTKGPQNVPTRHQTLRNAITWSYDLLNAEEQRLFRRFSIFVGGCMLQEAEAICGALDEEGEISVLDGVTSLIDKSLLLPMNQVVGEEPRLMMLETIREYGLEALAANEEMEVTQRAHALAYLALAEKAEPEFEGPKQAVWLDRLEREYGNLRIALQWSLEQGKAGHGMEIALRLSGALQQFWDMRGLRSEGRQFLGQALATSREVQTSVRMKALYTAAVLAMNQSDHDQAVELCEEYLSLSREHEDAQGTALSLYRLGGIAWAQGNLMVARSMEEEALGIFRELGDKWGIASSLEMLASVNLDMGEYARAHLLLEESLVLWREGGNERGIAYSLFLLARVIYYSLGDLQRARLLLEESITLSRRLGHKVSISYALYELGFVLFFQGDIIKTRSLFEEALALSKELGDRRGIASGLYSLGWVDYDQGHYMTARALLEESLAILRKLGHQWTITLCLEALARAIAAQGQLVGAAQLWGAAEALREAIGAPLPPIALNIHEQTVAAARAQMSEDAFASAWTQGRTMTFEQVLALQKPVKATGPITVASSQVSLLDSFTTQEPSSDGAV